MTIKTIFLTVAFFVILSLNAHAQSVATSIDDFWAKAGAAANITGPGVYQGQTTGHMTMGNVFLRAPQKTIHPMNIQLPSYRAGCGGIDLFGGGFSFINANEFIALGKSISTNAVGFVFKLGLETITPVIADTIGDLQTIANDINQMNINSCETSTALVGGLWPKADRASKTICEQLGTNTGVFSDYAAGRHGCGSNGQRTSTLATAPKSVQDQLPINTNIAWSAISNHPFLSSKSLPYKEFMMSLSGTYIIAGGADDDQAATFRSLPSVLEKGMLTAFLDGGRLQYYKCDELTKCLNPTLTNSELLTASQGFKQHILDKLTSMYSRIKNNTALDASEKDLLNLTSIPILKILNIYTAYEESLAILDMHQYADVIAIEIMTVWLVEIYTEINKLGIQSSLTESDAFAKWQDSFKTTRKEVEKVQDSTLKKFKSILDILDRAQKLESHLAMSLTDDIAGNFAFSKKLSSGGF